VRGGGLWHRRCGCAGGGGGAARIDDNAEAMVKRLQVFREQTGPVIAHFDKAGKVVRVNTSYSPAEVYEGVAKAVTPIVEAEVRRL
jgi:adenylate kinase family enzyme